MHKQTSAIRDIIIPLDRYPHLNENQTLQEAINLFLSFPTTEDNICYSKLLIVNDKNQLVGRLSQIDIMQGLAPRLMDAAKLTNLRARILNIRIWHFSTKNQPLRNVAQISLNQSSRKCNP